MNISLHKKNMTFLYYLLFALITSIICSYFLIVDNTYMKGITLFIALPLILSALDSGMEAMLYTSIVTILITNLIIPNKTIINTGFNVYLFDSFALACLCSIYNAIWYRKLENFRSISEYSKDYLETFAKKYYFLKLSYLTIEKDLIVKPITMRKIFTEIKLLKTKKNISNNILSIESSQRLMNLLYQFCNIEQGAIFAINDDKLVVKNSLAHIGDNFDIDENDFIVQHCLSQHNSHCVTIADNNTKKSDYIFCSLIISSSQKVYGILCVKKIKFLLFNNENLQKISVILGYFADLLNEVVLAKPITNIFPYIPTDFAAELSKLFHLKINIDLNASLLIINIPSEHCNDKLIDDVQQHIRALDKIWLNNNITNKSQLIILLPLANFNDANELFVRLIKNPFLEHINEKQTVTKHIHTISKENIIEQLKKLIANNYIQK